MSYDLAVWEGERPAGDAAAAQCFTDLYDKYIDADGADVPPTKQNEAYAAALLERSRSHRSRASTVPGRERRCAFRGGQTRPGQATVVNTVPLILPGAAYPQVAVAHSAGGP